MEAQLHTNQPQEKARQLYMAVWRWHFYAGIIFAPLLILLAITGGIYLFKPQLESWMYKDYAHVEAGQAKLTPSALIDKVKKSYPDGELVSFKPSHEPARAAEVGVSQNGEGVTVFVNPYDGKITGELKDSDRLMKKISKLHGELMAGKTGDRLVELAACWAMILIVTGVYLWWPRNATSVFGTLIPRFTQGKRTLWRDLHAVTAFWLSAFLVILIMTGLPWSGFWGDYVNKFATATHTGYPTMLWEEKPESIVPSKDVANVPWAAENLPVPASSATGHAPLPVEKIIDIAEAKKVHPGYEISFPEGEKGVYTVSVFPEKPEDQTTLHIDQYSGNVLVDLRFQDYGPMAKAIEIGIALHEGRYFGLANQLLGLLTCLGLVGISLTGLIMWWKRKPAGKLGAPSVPKSFTIMKSVAVIVIALGVFFPLAGASLLLVLLVDWLILKRIPAVKQYLG